MQALSSSPARERAPSSFLILKAERKMPAGTSVQVPVTFEDVAVCFSQEEWKGLEEWQKELYKEVMKENYQTLSSLGTGSLTITPEIISHIERGEEPYIRDEPGSEEGGTGKSSCSEINESKRRHKETHPEDLTKNLKMAKTVSEKDVVDTCPCCDWEKNCWNPCKPEERLRTPAEESAKKMNPCEQTTQHLRQETGLRPFSCSDCANKEILKLLQKIHTFPCSECNKIFIYPSELKMHQKIHSERKQFSFPDYDSFNWKVKLKKHERVDSGKKPFTCSECNRRFSWKSNLKKHERIHTGEKPFICTECDKSFSRKSNLKSHEKIHTGEKPFTCTECDRSFSWKSSLKMHEMIHTREKPFTCSECNKSFSRKSDLKSHEKIHTGEKPFTCAACDRSFSWKSSLKKHDRIHRTDKPFACTDCDKCFRLKLGLKMHQRIHTGGKSFTYSDRLMK
ncbi:zinc finger protein 664-like [Rhinatrema bivittatum]|uniref:zinc finger protein 664-like n=1 Tax=Rhinatrema bivittatum TaxID=194408 RepID=UPI0011269F9B|nr:zinc finger protein 664-like [Rhinatrema bivittatum]